MRSRLNFFRHKMPFKTRKRALPSSALLLSARDREFLSKTKTSSLLKRIDDVDDVDASLAEAEKMGNTIAATLLSDRADKTASLRRYVVNDDYDRFTKLVVKKDTCVWFTVDNVPFLDWVITRTGRDSPYTRVLTRRIKKMDYEPKDALSVARSAAINLYAAARPPPPKPPRRPAPSAPPYEASPLVVNPPPYHKLYPSLDEAHPSRVPTLQN